MTDAPRIILASGSAIRRAILSSAEIPFEVMKPEVDEDIIKKESAREGLDLEPLAMRLAEAKCMNIAAKTDAIVIGSDQIMEFGGRAYDKPATMAEAKARLMETQGAAHSLINAVAVARNGQIIWRNLDRPTLFMRALTEAEIDAYLDAAGPEILHSVGGCSSALKVIISRCWACRFIPCSIFCARKERLRSDGARILKRACARRGRWPSGMSFPLAGHSHDLGETRRDKRVLHSD